MGTPSISRAVTMGVIGFLAGALLVIVVRALQSLTPLWDPGVGIVFGTFFSAGFFVWGIGGFDPRMSVHGDEHGDHDEAHAADEPQEPLTLLGYSMWQIAFGLLIMLVVLGAAAWIGPALVTTADADASFNAVGMVPMELFGQEVLVSQLVIFTAFILFTLLSLGLAAGAIGFIINLLNRELVQTRATAAAAAGGGTAALPAPAEPRTRRAWLSTLLFIVAFAVIFYILYLLHYYVLIGLIFALPETTLTLLSAGAAFTITLLIMRGRWVVQLLARFAGWLGGVLRSRNNPYAGVQKNDRRNRR